MGAHGKHHKLAGRQAPVVPTVSRPILNDGVADVEYGFDAVVELEHALAGEHHLEVDGRCGVHTWLVPLAVG